MRATAARPWTRRSTRHRGDRWYLRPAFHFAVVANVVLLAVLLFALAEPTGGHQVVILDR